PYVESLFKKVSSDTRAIKPNVACIHLVVFKEGENTVAEWVVRNSRNHSSFNTRGSQTQCNIHFTSADIQVEFVGVLECPSGLSRQTHQNLSECNKLHE